MPIPPLGTTHADHFHGPVPVTRQLTADEIDGDYEAATGAVIVETLDGAGLDPSEMPAVLVASHGPFSWGRDAPAAVDQAILLEMVAGLAQPDPRARPRGGPHRGPPPGAPLPAQARQRRVLRAVPTVTAATAHVEVARLHAPGDIRVAREAVSEPGPGEVALRVTAVGLCGSDLHWYEEGSDRGCPAEPAVGARP